MDRELETGDNSKVIACKFVHGPTHDTSESSGDDLGQVDGMVPRFLVCATTNGKVVAFSHGAWYAEFSCPMHQRKVGACATFPRTQRPKTPARPATSKIEGDASSGSGPSPSVQVDGDASPIPQRESPHSVGRRSSDVSQMLNLSGSAVSLGMSSPNQRGSTCMGSHLEVLQTQSGNPQGSGFGSPTAETDSPATSKRTAVFPAVGLGALAFLRKPSGAQEPIVASAPLTAVSTSCMLDASFLIASGAQDGGIQIWMYSEEASPEGGVARRCTCTDVSSLHTAAVNCIAFAPDRFFPLAAQTKQRSTRDASPRYVLYRGQPSA